MIDYLKHVVSHKKKYLLPLTFVLLIFPLLINWIRSKPALMGVESYYHLVGFEFTPWRFITANVPETLVVIFPLFIGMLTVLLFMRISVLIKLDQKISVVFLLLVISSASFIFSFSTLSTYALYLFFVALGFWLALQSKLRYFSLLPFGTAALFDTFSSLLLLGLLLIYVGTGLKSLFRWSVFSLVAVLTGVNFFTKSFVLGPWQEMQPFPNLISDLGSFGGVSSFVVLLAIIGLSITWRKRKLYTSYGLGVVILAVYFVFPQTLLLTSLIMCFFAAVAVVFLYERSWSLTKLKNYTFLLIFLGLIFSSISYLDRVSDLGPSAEDKKAMLWIKENLGQVVVFSEPDNSYALRYLSEKDVIDYPHQQLGIQKGAVEELYIRQLFPILEKHKVRIVFISEKMKQDLSAEQGLLFLLRNERFKLVHSSGDAEVWSFQTN